MALETYPDERRKRILVVAIAPACYICKEICGDVIHYVSEDLVPRIDKTGMKRARGTIVKLKPHLDTNLFDHDFMSPTYEPYIQSRIRNYLNKGTLR